MTTVPEVSEPWLAEVRKKSDSDRLVTPTLTLPRLGGRKILGTRLASPPLAGGEEGEGGMGVTGISVYL
jgi:hypothetical protein